MCNSNKSFQAHVLTLFPSKERAKQFVVSLLACCLFLYMGESFSDNLDEPPAYITEHGGSTGDR